MQNKTIKKILHKKIEDWLSTIENIEVQQTARKDVVVTGGSIVSLIMGEPVNDFDVYFKSKSTTKAVAEYYAMNNDLGRHIEIKEVEVTNIRGEQEDRIISYIKSDGIASNEAYDEDSDEEFEEVEREDGKRYQPVFISENAITLSNKLQIITRFHGSIDVIHKNFDYIHATCSYDHDEYELDTPLEAIRSMQSMTLKYNGSLYPVCSLFRLRKFIKRGWSISAGDILKMAMQISEINLRDPVILRDQLTGVDALYFNMLIDALDKNEQDGEGRYSVPYILTIIDRIFSDE